MTVRVYRPDGIAWRDRLAVADHCTTVAMIVVAGIVDRRDASEDDWRDLTVALHRLRALRAAA